MKKRIFILSAVIMLLSVSAYAQISDTSVSEDGVLRVVGKTTEPEGTDISVLVVKPEKDYSNIVSDELEGEKAAGTLETIGQVKVGKDLVYEFTYKMHEDAVSGKYMVHAKAYGTDETDTGTFAFTNKKRLEEAFQKIIENRDVSEILKEHAYDIDYTSAEQYEKFTVSQKGFVAEVLGKSDITNTEMLKNEFSEFCEIVVLSSELKSADKIAVRDILEKSSEKFGIAENDYSDYSGLSQSKKEWVITNVISGSKSGMLPGEIANLFKEAVKTAKSNNTSGSGGSGGGSGGGVGMSSGFAAGTAPNVNVTPSETKNEFLDLENVPWAEEAINTLAKYEIINGKGQNLFAPNDNIKREEFVQMIVKSFNLSKNGQVLNFNDISKDAWYYEAVNTAYQCGIVKGKNEAEFGIGELITRQDMAVMLYRAAEFTEVEIFVVEPEEEVSDMEMVNDYAKDAVEKLVKANVINGDQNKVFNPENNATRAQAAVMIYNLLYK